MDGKPPDRLFEEFRRTRDAALLAELFDRTAPEVLRVALHLAPSPADAEDLLQETFLQLLESLERYEPRGRFMGWLLAILVHKAHQARRRRERALPALEEAQASPPETGLQARELRGAVARGLAGLPEPYREVLSLHLEQELPPALIADRLGRAPGTVRSQLHRGLELLRRFLPAGLAPGVAFVPTRGLPAVREVVLARAAALPVSAAGLAAAGLFGGWIMKKIVLAASALLAAGLVLVLHLDPASSLEVGERTAEAHAPLPSQQPAAMAPFLEEGRRPLAPADREGMLLFQGREFDPGRIPEEEALAIQVVHGATGEPLPGAVVAWLPHSLSAHAKLVDSGERSLEDLASQHGQKRVADEQGALAIPRYPTGAYLCGHWKELAGRAELYSGEEAPFRLVLDRVRTLVVQVVDSKGQPVSGVPLLLQATGLDCSTESSWKGCTQGTEGTATVRLLASQTKRQLEKPIYHLRFNLPSLKEPAVPVDLDRVQDTPVRMVLPPTGSILFFVTDEQGRPFLEPLIATIEGVNARLVEEGKALFPFVPLNLPEESHLAVYSPDQYTIPWQHVPFTGPRSPQERVVARMNVRPRATRITGRLVDEQGLPLGENLVAWSLGIHGSYNNGVLATDETGRFLLGVCEDPQAHFHSYSLKLTRWCRSSTEGKPLGPGAEHALPFPLPQGLIDIGEITILPERILAQGIVQDPCGEAVADVDVRVRALIPGEDAEKIESWHWRPDLYRRTDSQGCFRVQGHVTGPLEIRFSHPAYLQGTQRIVELRTEWARYVLQKGGSIAGSIRIDPEWEREEFLVWAGLRGQNREWKTANRKADGTFLLEGLLPGLWRIDLYHYSPSPGGKSPILFSVDDVEVRAGEVARDPRLQGVDLRGRVRKLRLRILGHTEFRNAGISILERDAKGASESLHSSWILMDRDGRVAFTVHGDASSFLLFAEGCRPRAIDWQAEEQAVSFEQGPLVKLRIAPFPPGNFYVTLHPEEEGSSRADHLVRRTFTPSTRLKEGAEATVRVTLPGRYRVAWMLFIPERGEDRPVIQEPPTILEVEDRPGEQLFTIGLNPHEIETARRNALEK